MKPTQLSTEDRWRFDLLSSSVPLEYRVGKQLADKGFVIRPDFQCERYVDEDRDWSVDINATAYPAETSDRLNGTLELLVECKYRRPGTAALFFPDPNTAQFGLIRRERALVAIDEFSDAFLHRSTLRKFSDSLPRCYKGVEIKPDQRKESKAVDDSELRHGLAQLQSAIPRLIAEHLRVEIGSLTDGPMESDLLPLICVPILVTTADLRVAAEEFDEGELLQKGLDGVSTAVDALITYLDPTVSYTQHWERKLSVLKEYEGSAGLKQLWTLRKTRFAPSIVIRSDLALRRLMTDSISSSRQYASKFIICTIDAFPSLVDMLISSSRTAIAEARRLTTEDRNTLQVDI